MASLNALAATIECGRQRFDGICRRRSVSVGGREALYDYAPLSMPPRSKTLPDGHVIEYDYAAPLENALLRLKADASDITTFTYDPIHSQIMGIQGGLGEQSMRYAPSGKLDSETWAVDGENHVSRRVHSLQDRLCSLISPDGTEHRRRYDAAGRLIGLSTDTVSVSFEYDDFSRLSRLTSTDLASKNMLSQTLAYDDFSREIERELQVTVDGVVRQLVQSLTYTARDKVASRTWTEGSVLALETYDYDARGRLIEYTANDIAASADPFGNRILKQTFTLNALDGNEQVVSEFADGSSDTATFSYNPDDPTQVVQVTHTHPSWPTTLTLKYDANGNVIEDGMGRTLTWDAQNRLVQVSKGPDSCDYRYSPGGKLVDRELNSTLTRSFYSGEQLVVEQRGDERLTFIGDGATVFAQSRLSEAIHTVTLLGCDAQGTVRIEADSDIRSPRYSPHGAGHTEDLQSPIGFAGERVDEFTGWYIPAGYRPYDPILMCFLSPDSESPFGKGGLNPYAYCAGDPVNNIDPDGHGWLNWLVTGIGLGLGVLATVASFGAAAPVLAAGISALTVSGALSVASAGLGAVSLATGVASAVLEATNSDQKAASILGWISLGTGLVGSAIEIGPGAMKSAARMSRLARRAKPPLKRSPSKKLLAGEWYSQFPDGSLETYGFDNYLGQNKIAYVTHGVNGELLTRYGNFMPAKWVAEYDIKPLVDRLSNFDRRKSVTLLACDGGQAAQEVADTLGRRVHAFDEIGGIYASYVYPNSSLSEFAQIRAYRPAGQNESLMRRLLGQWPEDWVELQPKTYHPIWRPWQ